MRLEINGLTYAYDAFDTISDVNLNIEKGEFAGIIGPNGSGKSTLLKNVYRALTPKCGTINLDGENLLTMKYKESSRKIASIGQENDIPFDFTVEEIVAMGRSPHKKLLESDNEHDRYMVYHALEHLGMENMIKRSFRTLSGGEKQRVLLARAVAQESDFLILDEPTNHLDINYQLQMFDFIKRLKITVLSAMHDLNMAALYCDTLYGMENGKIIFGGKTEEVLTEENIFRLYGVKCSISKHPITEKLTVTFLPHWTERK